MNESPVKSKNWISFRVKPDEFQTIHNHFSKSTCRKMSEYARQVLLQQPVIIRYRSETADEFLNQMLLLKKELNAIGNNFNQVVHKLHTCDNDQEIKDWLAKNGQLHDVFIARTHEIFSLVNQIHRKWLSV